VRKRFPEAEIAIVGRPYVADIYRDQEIAINSSLRSESLHAGFSGASGWQPNFERRSRRGFAAAKCLRCRMACLACKYSERIGYARDVRSFLLTKAWLSLGTGKLLRMKSFITWNSCAVQVG